MRLVEDLRIKVRDAIRIDPIRPVAQIYEELFSDLKNSLEGAPREEFISMCPPLSSMIPSLYRCVSSFCVPLSLHPGGGDTVSRPLQPLRLRSTLIPGPDLVSLILREAITYKNVIVYVQFDLFHSRFCRDTAGNSLLVGDYQYPGEPDGRILVFSSSWILDWLAERHLEGLHTISRIGVDGTFKVLKALIG